ncbi:MAG TPA: ABC transporter permease [Candidatus Saccharimonadales bacterium]|nr:ABC transporter permease [Candidatus Saccharimonadales bacterium]
MSVLLPASSLAWREVIRFLRQRSRVLGSLGQGILLWVLIGGGFQASFRPPGARMGYVEYFFPGILALVVLFTAVFATIAVVEDRHSGFLQGVLVSPVPRWGVVLGQAAGSTILAVGQAVILLPLAPLIGVPLTFESAAAAIGVMTLVALAVSGLSLIIAWKLTTTQGFHAIMNLIIFPLWWLSGSLFPQQGLPGWIAWIVKLNPLTYGIVALRRAIYIPEPEAVAGLAPMGVSLAVSAAFCLLMFGMAVRAANTSKLR